MHGLGVHDIITVMTTVARAKIQDPRFLFSHVKRWFQENSALSFVSAHQLQQLAWACGSIGGMPQGLAQCLAEELQIRLQLHQVSKPLLPHAMPIAQLTCRSHVNLINGKPVVSHSPHRHITASTVGVVTSQGRSCCLSPSCIATVLWALGTVRYPCIAKSPALLPDVVQHVGSILLERLRPLELASTLRALALCGHTPRPFLDAALVRLFESSFSGAPPHVVAVQAQHATKQGKFKVLGKTVSHSSAARRSASADSAAHAPHGRSKTATPATWEAVDSRDLRNQDTVPERRPLVAHAQAAALSELASALMEWGHSPSEGWMQMLTQRCLELKDEATLQDLAGIFYALASLEPPVYEMSLYRAMLSKLHAAMQNGPERAWKKGVDIGAHSLPGSVVASSHVQGGNDLTAACVIKVASALLSAPAAWKPVGLLSDFALHAARVAAALRHWDKRGPPRIVIDALTLVEHVVAIKEYHSGSHSSLSLLMIEIEELLLGASLLHCVKDLRKSSAECQQAQAQMQQEVPLSPLAAAGPDAVRRWLAACLLYCQYKENTVHADAASSSSVSGFLHAATATAKGLSATIQTAPFLLQHCLCRQRVKTSGSMAAQVAWLVIELWKHGKQGPKGQKQKDMVSKQALVDKCTSSDGNQNSAGIENEPFCQAVSREMLADREGMIKIRKGSREWHNEVILKSGRGTSSKGKVGRECAAGDKAQAMNNNLEGKQDWLIQSERRLSEEQHPASVEAAAEAAWRQTWSAGTSSSPCEILQVLPLSLSQELFSLLQHDAARLNLRALIQGLGALRALNLISKAADVPELITQLEMQLAVASSETVPKFCLNVDEVCLAISTLVALGYVPPSASVRMHLDALAMLRCGEMSAEQLAGVIHCWGVWNEVASGTQSSIAGIPVQGWAYSTLRMSSSTGGWYQKGDLVKLCTALSACLPNMAVSAASKGTTGFARQGKGNSPAARNLPLGLDARPQGRVLPGSASAAVVRAFMCMRHDPGLLLLRQLADSIRESSQQLFSHEISDVLFQYGRLYRKGDSFSRPPTCMIKALVARAVRLLCSHSLGPGLCRQQLNPIGPMPTGTLQLQPQPPDGFTAKHLCRMIWGCITLSMEPSSGMATAPCPSSGTTVFHSCEAYQTAQLPPKVQGTHISSYSFSSQSSSIHHLSSVLDHNPIPSYVPSSSSRRWNSYAGPVLSLLKAAASPLMQDLQHQLSTFSSLAAAATSKTRQQSAARRRRRSVGEEVGSWSCNDTRDCSIIIEELREAIQQATIAFLEALGPSASQEVVAEGQHVRQGKCHMTSAREMCGATSSYGENSNHGNHDLAPSSPSSDLTSPDWLADKSQQQQEYSLLAFNAQLLSANSPHVVLSAASVRFVIKDATELLHDVGLLLEALCAINI
ncbi:hypothetical protein CEUSTIGMA_g11964.t1 [Chlamydomonas eustigma]|uniref:Uncharacterized protein n=1 Tax=Chlamydomonas eustigma TaxID=1157962 RepID=A0A250XNI0_9CHLO|nr:hypothetical protein CEUSTIGMA_g11964.t1 [Chlamydomonas eustigma]|eukprot:GAX84543.1 hypothetical protein CEUSTIGMA_g11964.t1 [Chlamydomonas eustigma]